MSPDGANCGLVVREKDLEDVSCPCGQGYVNNEGTFVPGEMIRHGHALHRKHYEDHVDCEVCTRDPTHCDWRRKRLERPTSRKLLVSPPSGFFQFFVPGKAIHEAVLREFLSVNVGKRADCLPEKRFKGQSGFYVRSNFRFNSQDMRQLEQLTQLKSQGREWRKSLRRISTPKPQPFTEFTRYLDRSTGRSATTETQTSARRPIPSAATSQDDRHGDSRHPSQVPYSTKSRSQHETTQEDFADDVPELTSATRRVHVSERSRRDSSPSLESRRWHLRDDVSSEGYSREGYRQPGEEEGTDDRLRTSQSWHDSEGPRTSRHAIIPQEPSTHEESKEERQYRRPSVPQAATRDDSRRRSAQKDSEEVPIRPEHARRGSAQYSTSYAGRHAKQDDRSSEHRPSYTASSAYSTQVAGRKASRDETQEADDLPTRSRSIRFFVPSEGLDLVVLAFYLKTVVDASAKIQSTTHDGRVGFLVDAKRDLTRDELEDIMYDTESWQKEQRKLPASARYPDSGTARQRKKRSG